jgi:hypothetical protein
MSAGIASTDGAAGDEATTFDPVTEIALNLIQSLLALF